MSQHHAHNPETEPIEDYLTPEQRIKAIADILSTIALRIIKNEQEHHHEPQDENQS